jgi:hypothetical protein
MYPGYRLKVLPRITFSVLLYLHLKPTAGCQMSTSAKKNWAVGGPLGINPKGIAKAVYLT